MPSSQEQPVTIVPAGPAAAADDGFRPAPGAPTWDVRAVRRIMAQLSPPPAHDGAEGWYALREDGGVAVHRIMGEHYHRPGAAGRDRDEWDALIRRDREHLAVHGMVSFRPGQSETCVWVPRPEQPQTTASVRRIGAPSAFTSGVAFEGFAGIGGTLRYVGTGAARFYEVANHLGTVVREGVTEGLDAVEVLADHYGFPLPVRVIPRSAR